MIVAGLLEEGAHAIGAPPDYHALGTFSETWAFLELFIGRCAQLTAGEDQHEAGFNLQARLDALNAAVRLAPELQELSTDALALTAEIRAVALKRQEVLQDLARASLTRLGLSLFALPSKVMEPNAIGRAFSNPKALDELHLKACDLVRRTLLLLSALDDRLATRS